MTDQAALDGTFDRVAHAHEVRDTLPVGLPRAVISNLLAVIAERDATIARVRAVDGPEDDEIRSSLTAMGFDFNDRYPGHSNDALIAAWQEGYSTAMTAARRALDGEA